MEIQNEKNKQKMNLKELVTNESDINFNSDSEDSGYRF